MKQLFLHVGLPKTATKSIQESLFAGAEILLKENILYPKYFGINQSIPLFSLFDETPEKHPNHIRNSRDKQKVKQLNQENLSYFSKISKERENFNSIILSGEEVCFLSESSLKQLYYYLSRLFPEFKLITIVYVRNHYDFFTSYTQQWIKSGLQRPKFPIEIYKPFMQKFINVVGIESIKVYSFEKACKYKYGPVGNILKIINFPSDKIKDFPLLKVNESSSQRSIELVEFINSDLPFFLNDKVNNGRKLYDTLPLNSISGPKFQLTAQENFQLNLNLKTDLIWLKTIFNIDYTNFQFPKDSKEILYNDTYYVEFIAAFKEISNPLKIILYKFIKTKISQDLEIVSKEVFVSILNYINEYFPEISSYFEKTIAEHS
jgi:hypothetical protein